MAFKPKKTKEISSAELKRKLDSIFSIFIRLRDKGVCFTCGKKLPWKQQQNGHYISRSILSLRWDEKNCNCQCVGCNIFRHGNMPAYALALVRKYGPKILEEFAKESRKITKISRKEYLEKIAFYQKVVDRLLKNVS